MGSEKRFGYEWNKYSEIDPNYEVQFLKWIYPLQPEDFKGKKVLDAGCGMGRNSYWALKYGAGDLVAFDFDQRSVAAAKRNLSGFKDVQVEFRNIYDLPWQNEFDLVFSIGVIHHLENHGEAIKNLIRAAKPGGRILLWVYGHEGNEWIVKLVSPVRKFLTSKLPVGLVHLLSYLASAPLWAWVKIFHGPGPYLKQLSGFSFYHIHSIVFDQLIPKIAHYWTKEEARSLLSSFEELKDIEIHQVNSNSWTVLGEKK